MLWEKLLSLVLLLLLSSQLLFSEYVLTDEAYEKLVQLQSDSENLTKSDKLTIQGLEKKLTISEQITTLDQILIEKQEKSLEEQNTDSFFSKLEIFIWGLVSGLFFGLYTGIKLKV